MEKTFSDALNCVNNSSVDNVNITMIPHMRTLKFQQRKKLDINKACESDGVYSEHIKYASNIFMPLLNMCFTSCIAHGFLPASVLPVVLLPVKVKSSPRHYALGSHKGLYGQCLNLVSVVRSNLECSYTDSPGRDTSPSQVPSKQCLYSFAAE